MRSSPSQSTHILKVDLHAWECIYLYRFYIECYEYLYGPVSSVFDHCRLFFNSRKSIMGDKAAASLPSKSFNVQIKMDQAQINFPRNSKSSDKLLLRISHILIWNEMVTKSWTLPCANTFLDDNESQDLYADACPGENGINGDFFAAYEYVKAEIERFTIRWKDVTAYVVNGKDELYPPPRMWSQQRGSYYKYQSKMKCPVSSSEESLITNSIPELFFFHDILSDHCQLCQYRTLFHVPASDNHTLEGGLHFHVSQSQYNVLLSCYMDNFGEYAQFPIPLCYSPQPLPQKWLDAQSIRAEPELYNQQLTQFSTEYTYGLYLPNWTITFNEEPTLSLPGPSCRNDQFTLELQHLVGLIRGNSDLIQASLAVNSLKIIQPSSTEVLLKISGSLSEEATQSTLSKIESRFELDPNQHCIPSKVRDPTNCISNALPLELTCYTLPNQYRPIGVHIDKLEVQGEYLHQVLNFLSLFTDYFLNPVYGCPWLDMTNLEHLSLDTIGSFYTQINTMRMEQKHGSGNGPTLCIEANGMCNDVWYEWTEVTSAMDLAIAQVTAHFFNQTKKVSQDSFHDAQRRVLRPLTINLSTTFNMIGNVYDAKMEVMTCEFPGTDLPVILYLSPKDLDYVDTFQKSWCDGGDEDHGDLSGEESALECELKFNSLSVVSPHLQIIVIHDHLHFHQPLLRFAWIDFYFDSISQNCIPDLMNNVPENIATGQQNPIQHEAIMDELNCITVSGQLAMDYFNNTLKCWEPILEPWQTKWIYTHSTIKPRGFQMITSGVASCNINSEMVDALFNYLDKTPDSWLNTASSTYNPFGLEEEDSSLLLTTDEQHASSPTIPPMETTCINAEYYLLNFAGQSLQYCFNSQQYEGSATPAAATHDQEIHTLCPYERGALDCPAYFSVEHKDQVVEGLFDHHLELEFMVNCARASQLSSASMQYLDRLTQSSVKGNDISIQVDGFEWIHGISLRKIGASFHTLIPSSEGSPGQGSPDVQHLLQAVVVVSNTKIGRSLCIQSSIMIRNKSSTDLQIMACYSALSYDQALSEEMMESNTTVVVRPNGVYHIPIYVMYEAMVASEGEKVGSIFIRPVNLPNQTGASSSSSQVDYFQFGRAVDLLETCRNRQAILECPKKTQHKEEYAYFSLYDFSKQQNQDTTPAPKSENASIYRKISMKIEEELFHRKTGNVSTHIEYFQSHELVITSPFVFLNLLATPLVITIYYVNELNRYGQEQCVWEQLLPMGASASALSINPLRDIVIFLQLSELQCQNDKPLTLLSTAQNTQVSTYIYISIVDHLISNICI